MRWILLLLAILAAGCASPEDDAGAPRGVFPDVHGVAIDPADPAFVYVATHSGLFRGDGAGWEHVGESRDDFMGFTAASDGKTFYASGHPRGGGNLGLIRSRDAGLTWVPIGAAGADFHAMTVSPADANRLYGHWRGQVLRSDDGGARWTEQAKMGVAALAAHPTQPDVVYAATGQGVARSDDAGATWRTLTQLPALGVAAGDALYLGGNGFVARSADGGATWGPVTMPRAETFAHLATRGDSVVVASYQGGLYRSDDAGASWRTLHEPSR